MLSLPTGIDRSCFESPIEISSSSVLPLKSDPSNAYGYASRSRYAGTCHAEYILGIDNGICHFFQSSTVVSCPTTRQSCCKIDGVAHTSTRYKSSAGN